MDSKKKILIIHPEGNIYNNPNLYEIIKLLNKTYDLTLLIPDIEINQNIDDYKDLVISYHPIFNKFKIRIKNMILYKLFFYFFKFLYIRKKIDFIIGIDRMGIIDAYLLSKSINCPYAHISYEITFKDETVFNYKEIEIEASENVRFSIVQDDVRAFHLSNENKIPIEKMLCVPVASSNMKAYKKSYLLYDKLKIDKNKKILLFVGSVTKWSCIKEIVEEVHNFPDDWVLVLHDRYGESEKKLSNLIEEYNIEEKIYFSNEPIKSNSDMHTILHSADLGLALYCPDYETIYTGKNLEYIGLASGKISTYFQNGVPVITYKNTQYGQYVNEYNLGYAIKSIKDISEYLKKYENNILNKNCIHFFNTKLKFKNYESIILNKIKENID